MAGLFDFFGTPQGDTSIPKNLLELIPADQRAAVIEQAKSNYMRGFLSGGRGTGLLGRFGNAMAAEQNTPLQYMQVQNQAASLAAHQLDLARRQAFQEAVNSARNPDGSIDYTKLQNTPGYQTMLSPSEMNTVYGPKPTVVNGRIVNANDPNNQNKVFPQLGEGMTQDPNGNVTFAPGYRDTKNQGTMDEQAIKQTFNLPPGMTMVYDGNGKPVGVMNQQGFVQALGQQENVKEEAKSNYTPETVVGPDGREYTIPRTQKLYGKDGQNLPTKLSPGEITDQQKRAEDFNAFRTEVATKSQNASSRMLNAQILSGLSDRFDTNDLAPIKAQVGNYMRGLGISSDKIDQYTSDVKAFQTFREQKLRDDVSMFKGSQSDRELGVLQNMGQSVTKPGDLNKFYSAFEIAQARRDQLIADAIDKYQGPADRVKLQKYVSEQPFMKQSLFADPAFKGLSIGGQPVVIEQEYKGKRYLRVPLTKTVIPLN